MSDEDGINSDIRSREEEYFRRKDRELVEKMRQAAESDASRQAMEQTTGIHDPVLLQELEALGFTPDTVSLLPLVPIVQVAWAEGGVSENERKLIVEILLRICREENKLDMREGVIREFLAPPASPDQCIFAKTTLSLSADLRTKVVPCQFGGNPDCSRCGCMASMALAAVGHRKILGPVTAGGIFWISTAIGSGLKAGADRIRHETRAT